MLLVLLLLLLQKDKSGKRCRHFFSREILAKAYSDRYGKAGFGGHQEYGY